MDGQHERSHDTDRPQTDSSLLLVRVQIARLSIFQNLQSQSLELTSKDRRVYARQFVHEPHNLRTLPTRNLGYTGQATADEPQQSFCLEMRPSVLPGLKDEAE